MCDYTGQYDRMRTFHETWSAEEYGRLVTGLTKATFTSLDEPLLAFDKIENPLPSVSPVDSTLFMFWLAELMADFAE